MLETFGGFVYGRSKLKVHFQNKERICQAKHAFTAAKQLFIFLVIVAVTVVAKQIRRSALLIILTEILKM